MSSGRPLRVAFAGDAARFAAWVPGGVAAAARPVAAADAIAPLPGLDGGAAGRIRPLLLDTRGLDAAETSARLRDARPDVVVALGVADHEAEALGAGAAPVLGVAVAAERPPAWALRAAPPGEAPDEELLAAAASAERRRLWAPDSPGARCDRLVALDPCAAVGARLWRLIAPPVDDDLLAPARRPFAGPRIVCAAPSTEHREWWLAPSKHLHDLRHVAHGITPERLPGFLARVDVAVVGNPTDRPSFDHRVAVHLAAGHLVVAERLGPRHGLEPGLDLVEAPPRYGLARTLESIRRAPGLFQRVRVRGRLKAESFRASRVWARVLHDFLLDL